MLVLLSSCLYLYTFSHRDWPAGFSRHCSFLCGGRWISWIITIWWIKWLLLSYRYVCCKFVLILSLLILRNTVIFLVLIIIILAFPIIMGSAMEFGSKNVDQVFRLATENPLLISSADLVAETRNMGAACHIPKLARRHPPYSPRLGNISRNKRWSVCHRKSRSTLRHTLNQE